MCVYLLTKFQVSNILLTSFRQVVILPHPSHPHNAKQFSKKPTLIRVKQVLECYVVCEYAIFLNTTKLKNQILIEFIYKKNSEVWE